MIYWYGLQSNWSVFLSCCKHLFRKLICIMHLFGLRVYMLAFGSLVLSKSTFRSKGYYKQSHKERYLLESLTGGREKKNRKEEGSYKECGQESITHKIPEQRTQPRKYPPRTSLSPCGSIWLKVQNQWQLQVHNPHRQSPNPKGSKNQKLDSFQS